MGAILPNLRLILTGKGMGPSLFEIAALLGREEVMKRFKERSTFYQNMFIKNQNESD
jgi:glutamyl/glutaminyl-tRNA synthetase